MKRRKIEMNSWVFDDAFERRHDGEDIERGLQHRADVLLAVLAPQRQVRVELPHARRVGQPIAFHVLYEPFKLTSFPTS